MDPDGWVTPFGCLEGGFPRLRCRGQCVGIKRTLPAQFCDRCAGFRVAHCQWLAATKVVRTGGWPASGINTLQGGYELRQLHCRLAQISNAFDGRVLAFEPPADGPIPW